MSARLDGVPVLVTGADGFIGSWLVERLVRAGARVRAFVYYNSWNAIGWLSELAPDLRRELEIFRGDVRDAERVAAAVQGREYVFHLASLVAIPYSYCAPRSYIETNVIGALNVLEACRHSDSLTRLLHTSTSEVYGGAQRVPIDESHPTVPQSPYAASKLAADELARSYHLSFELPLAIARPFNTYGPRQTARAVIPTIAAQLLAGCRTLELGATAPTRDFCFARDTAEAMLRLALCAAAEGQVVNVGTGSEIAIGALADLLMTLCKRQVPIRLAERRLRPSQSEVQRLCASHKRLMELTGWQPETSLRDGLAETVDWIAANLEHFEPESYGV